MAKQHKVKQFANVKFCSYIKIKSKVKVKVIYFVYLKSSPFCRVVLSVLYGLAIILPRKKYKCSWFLYFCVYYVLCLFLLVPWVGVESAIVVFPGFTPLLLVKKLQKGSP